MKNNNLYFAALLTHQKSKYLNEKLVHESFESIVKHLGIKSSYVQIKDCYHEMDFTYFDIFRQYNQVVVLLITQFTIYTKVFFKVSISNKINVLKILLDVCFISIKRLILLFSATFSKKYRNILRSLVLRHSNISHNHISLLSKGVKNGKPRVLILEDDIVFKSLSDVQSGLEMVISAFEFNDEIKLMNISESFSLHQLGLDNFNTKMPLPRYSTHFTVYCINYPATNTVCATMYRSEFIPDLLLQLQKMNPLSLVPIDIKINLALHRLVRNRVIVSSAYSTIIPGLFQQGSLINE